jgi:hypothetical protein
MWNNLFISIVGSIIAACVIFYFVHSKEWFKILIGRYRLNKRIYKAGITNIYESRDDYAKYRNYPKITPKLLDYLKLAEKNIYISAYWMAHGTEIEGITQGIIDLVKPPKSLNITVCVINPDSQCINAISQHLGMPEKELVERIRTSITKLKQAKNRLSKEEKQKMTIKTHDSLPVASAIILDYDSDNCRMQLEFKPYQVDRHYNCSIELSGKEKGLYKLLSDSFIKQINDANKIN